MCKRHHVGSCERRRVQRGVEGRRVRRSRGASEWPLLDESLIFVFGKDAIPEFVGQALCEALGFACGHRATGRYTRCRRAAEKRAHVVRNFQ